MSNTAPKSFRLHIGIFGRRNAGKSSLLNSLTRQESSIVSSIAGTTTDPVEKAMELLPIGPVLFIDTAGVDDVGPLGELRIKKTQEVFDRTELGIIVCDISRSWSDYEESILRELRKREIPVLIVMNKSDLGEPSIELRKRFEAEKMPCVSCSMHNPGASGILREGLIQALPEKVFAPPPILSDLLPEGGTAVLVIPIDKEAPKGRLILPEVQCIRDLLDYDRRCVIVKETQLAEAIENLKIPPAIVITDSQAFGSVSKIVPKNIFLSSFSILFARQKGDLAIMLKGAEAIGTLKEGDKVMIAESCAHHPISDDIGTVKIPNWLEKFLGFPLDITHVQGHDFPHGNLSEWKLVIHCGACMWNRREMLSRLMHCEDAGVPITNYGIAIAYLHGILDRAIAVFRKNEII